MKALIFPPWLPPRLHAVYRRLLACYSEWRARKPERGPTRGLPLRLIARLCRVAKATAGELLALMREHRVVWWRRFGGRREDIYYLRGDYPTRISPDEAFQRLPSARPEPQRLLVPQQVQESSLGGDSEPAPPPHGESFSSNGGVVEPPASPRASVRELRRLRRTIFKLVVLARYGDYDREGHALALESGRFLLRPTPGLQIHAILQHAGVLDHEPTRAKLALRLSRLGWDPEGLAEKAIEIIRSPTVVFPPSFLYRIILRMLHDGIKVARPLVRRLFSVNEAIGWHPRHDGGADVDPRPLEEQRADEVAESIEVAMAEMYADAHASLDEIAKRFEVPVDRVRRVLRKPAVVRIMAAIAQKRLQR